MDVNRFLWQPACHWPHRSQNGNPGSSWWRMSGKEISVSPRWLSEGWNCIAGFLIPDLSLLIMFVFSLVSPGNRSELATKAVQLPKRKPFFRKAKVIKWGFCDSTLCRQGAVSGPLESHILPEGHLSWCSLVNDKCQIFNILNAACSWCDIARFERCAAFTGGVSV